MVAYAASVVAEHAQSVGFVHHDGAVVLMLQLYNLRQVREVALHREHAVYHNQLHCLVGQTFQDVLQVFHVVVLVVQLTGKRQTTSVHDAGVVAVVTDDVVATSYNNGKHTGVYRESGREAQSVVFVYKLSQLFLELYVQVECSVKETATRTSRAIFVKGCLCSIYHTLVSCESSISVGTEHKNFMSAHLNFRALLTGYLTEVRIYTSLHVLLRHTIALVFFL